MRCGLGRAEEYILNKVYFGFHANLYFPMMSILNRAQTVRRFEALFALGFPKTGRNGAPKTEINANRAELEVNFKPRRFCQKIEIIV